MANDKRVLRLPAVMGTHRAVQGVNLPPYPRGRFPERDPVGISGGGVARATH